MPHPTTTENNPAPQQRPTANVGPGSGPQQGRPAQGSVWQQQATQGVTTVQQQLDQQGVVDRVPGSTMATVAPANVGMVGNAPELAVVKPAEPVLFDDIDPSLLGRLYPNARLADGLREQAMAAGQKTYVEGLQLHASMDDQAIQEGRDPTPDPTNPQQQERPGERQEAPPVHQRPSQQPVQPQPRTDPAQQPARANQDTPQPRSEDPERRTPDDNTQDQERERQERDRERQRREQAEQMERERQVRAQRERDNQDQDHDHDRDRNQPGREA